MTKAVLKFATALVALATALVVWHAGVLAFGTADTTRDTEQIRGSNAERERRAAEEQARPGPETTSKRPPQPNRVEILADAQPEIEPAEAERDQSEGAEQPVPAEPDTSPEVNEETERAEVTRQVAEFLLMVTDRETHGHAFDRARFHEAIELGERAYRARVTGYYCRALTSWFREQSRRIGAEVVGGTFRLDDTDEQRLRRLAVRKVDECG